MTVLLIRWCIGVSYFVSVLSLCRRVVLSSLLLLVASMTHAHELRPAIGNFTLEDGQLSLTIDLNLEALLAGIDLSAHKTTGESPETAEYDALRAETASTLSDRLSAVWPTISESIKVDADGQPLGLDLVDTMIPDTGDVDLPRDSTVLLTAALPDSATSVRIGWIAAFGPLVLRQQGVEGGYTGYLSSGDLSDPVPITGGSGQSWFAVFADYVVIGFEHIVPKGLDHILFVLGLFFLSLKFGPLLWQVSAFTIAHTITLALGILGIVTLPASLVEPLIAASIVYVGVENVLSKGLTPWRPIIVFLFGLLHGLGFASVLGDVGLDPGTFATSLIGFNVGVELGQLTVIAIAFLTVGLWFGKKPCYTSYIANPASIAIALVGAYWVVERTLL